MFYLSREESSREESSYECKKTKVSYIEKDHFIHLFFIGIKLVHNIFALRCTT